MYEVFGAPSTGRLPAHGAPDGSGSGSIMTCVEKCVVTSTEMVAVAVVTSCVSRACVLRVQSTHSAEAQSECGAGVRQRLADTKGDADDAIHRRRSHTHPHPRFEPESADRGTSVVSVRLNWCVFARGWLEKSMDACRTAGTEPLWGLCRTGCVVMSRSCPRLCMCVCVYVCVQLYTHT